MKIGDIVLGCGTKLEDAHIERLRIIGEHGAVVRVKKIEIRCIDVSPMLNPQTRKGVVCAVFSGDGCENVDASGVYSDQARASENALAFLRKRVTELEQSIKSRRKRK